MILMNSVSFNVGFIFLWRQLLILDVVFGVTRLCDLKACWLQEQEGGKCAKWDGLIKQVELNQGKFKYWPLI